MAIPQTTKNDPLEIFRDNANTTANNVGDIATLTTTDKTSVVNAVNEIDAAIPAANSFSIAMAVAL